MGLPSWSLSSCGADDDLHLLKPRKGRTTSVVEKHINKKRGKKKKFRFMSNKTP